MTADSVLSWAIITILFFYGFYKFLKLVITEYENKYNNKD